MGKSSKKLSTKNFPKKTVFGYLDVIKSKIKLDGALLFGAFAYGNPDENSDVDMAIISRDFEKMSFDKRIDWLQINRLENNEIGLGVAMDLIGYTPKEFENINQHSAIMNYAKKHGKWLYQRNK